ncbi:MAG: hypothetical protein Q7R39_02415 [Dehalococcoidia bacterium]|nr:hypothetical protein [Dehalococcoidia bacterium]
MGSNRQLRFKVAEHYQEAPPGITGLPLRVLFLNVADSFSFIVEEMVESRLDTRHDVACEGCCLDQELRRQAEWARPSAPYREIKNHYIASRVLSSGDQLLLKTLEAAPDKLGNEIAYYFFYRLIVEGSLVWFRELFPTSFKHFRDLQQLEHSQVAEAYERSQKEEGAAS